MLKFEWDRMADYWNKDAGDTGVWHNYTDIDPVIFELLGNVKNKKILEIGCGNGYLSRLLAKQGVKVVGIDLSQKLLDYAIEKEKVRPLGIKYFQRNAANLTGIKNKTFDIAIANMCLMDVRNAEKAIKEISRVLKKNGKFIFSINHPVFFYQKWIYAKRNGKKFFARAVLKYKTPCILKQTLWSTGIKVMGYRRPIEEYLKYLKKAGFVIDDFREIVSKKKLKKARKGHLREDKFKSSRYIDEMDKKLKKAVKTEIPDFLIIAAIKK
ncbi:MAG: class I SAM-dependent methyltransferase [Candidatus Omnitrophota bacterium]